MDKIYFKIFKRLFIGLFLIILEFVLYNYFDVLIKNQLIIILVTFYLARISYSDIDSSDLFINQGISILLGILYGYFTMSNPAMYALFFYGVTTFMTKYARKDNLYISYFYITFLYFAFFVIRVFYMIFMHGVAFEVVDIILKNIILLTFVNASLCYLIAIYKAIDVVKLKHKKNL